MLLNKDLTKHSKEFSSNNRSVSSASMAETDLEKLPDEELVKRCLDNDKNAWNEFFRWFIPDINIKPKFGTEILGN